MREKFRKADTRADEAYAFAKFYSRFFSHNHLWQGYMDEKTRQKIEKALVKRAIGYDTMETIEEFSEGEDEMRLTKRKVTTKSVPPDISAAKLLFDMQSSGEDISELSDKQLEEEKQRLLKLLEVKPKNENHEL